MAFHRIDIIDNPIGPSNTNPSNPTNPNSNSSNPNHNNNGSIPTNSIKQVLKQNTNQVPNLLIDYSAKAEHHEIEKVLFRDNITRRLLVDLCSKRHPNVLLIGDAGTGKTAIVEDLAVRLFEKDPIVCGMLDPKTRIYELPLNSLVAGSSLVGTTEAKLQEVIDFIENPQNHAILFVDEIHQLTTNHALQSVSEILKPALARGAMHVIGCTTTQERKLWDQNPALNRRFSTLIVDELNDRQTLTVLKQTLTAFQDPSSPVTITNDDLTHIISTANRYARSLNMHRPDSAITILDQSLQLAKLQTLQLQQTGMTNITPTVTDKIIETVGHQLVNTDQTDIDFTTVDKLKDRLSQNLIGQNYAKQLTVQAIQSLALNLTAQNRPHSFLYAGPSGTGKTEMAKQLAASVFGGSDHFIYLNMTEYASNASLTRLIGSSRGYIGSDSIQPLPLDGLKSNPFQLVLLDEFEKAAPDVQRIFMQALDEGQIQYSDGSVVDFSHAIVIATTNAGSQQLSAPKIGFNHPQSISSQSLNHLLTDNFPPELLNRFEYVVNFDPITYDEYRQILLLKYQQLQQAVARHRPEITITPQHPTISSPFIKKLADQTYDPIKNARPAERTVRHYVETKLLSKRHNTTTNKH